MLRFILRRLAYAGLLLLAVVTLNFLLIHISPGDPVETIAGSMGGISEELRAQLRTQCCAATWAIPTSSRYPSPT
ncbi:hypothetical protein G6F60_015413 [Rhizopus arrhizus]|nr:hypothetical protein G6F60_015413 [Rhizopus arrhizus]